MSIRAKLMAAMGAWVLISTLVYLGVAVRVFQSDKESLIRELNAQAVKTLIAQADASLSRAVEQARLLTQGHQDERWVRSVLEAESDLAAFTLYRADDHVEVARMARGDFWKLYGLTPAALDEIRKQVPVPWPRLEKESVWVWGSTLSGKLPLVSVGVRIDVEGRGQPVPHIAVLDLRADTWVGWLGAGGDFQRFLVDGDGATLVDVDSTSMESRRSRGDSALVAEALASPVRFQLKPFDYAGERWMGAYGIAATGGVRAISQAPEKLAFSASRRLIEKSAAFGLLVLTLAIFFSSRLAGAMTRPIQGLVAATERLARWDFSESVHVSTRDELSVLARGFNAMAAGLQAQRSQIEASKGELERQVRERTAQLEAEKKKVTEAQESLVRTTRLASLGELAGVAAHEVLNPVNNMGFRVEKLKQAIGAQKSDLEAVAAIGSAWQEAYARGGLEGLRAELEKSAADGKPLVEEDLSNIQTFVAREGARLGERGADLEFLAQEMARISKIVNNLRSLSRVGGERRALDIHDALDDTAAALGATLDKQKVSLVREYSQDPRDRFSVTADQDELVQVFSNLVRNAVYAVAEAKRRSGEVKLSTSREADRVVVRVTDNGTGIRPEHLEKLWETQFTTKSAQDGTGLGLSICRRIVRAFGGEIEVERTRTGEGTVFKVWLPASNP